MNKTKQGHISLTFFLILIMGLMFFQCFAFAGDKEEYKDRPERLITMAVEYPGIVIPPDEDVSMDIIFHNKGRSDENVVVWTAKKPDNWKVRVKTYRFTVTGVHVPSGDDKTLTFEAEPGKDVKPGKYEFRVEAKTRDEKFRMAETVFVTVREKEEGEKKEKGVRLTTSYPVLRGPSDGKFEFSMEVDSKLDKDAVFDLFAKGPEGWDINFKPAYESKYISSLRLRAGQNSSIAVEVKPSAKAEAGEYPVSVRVTSGDAKSEAELIVILTGTHDMNLRTPSGLLSLDAKQGKPANMSVFIENSGSAVIKDIKFMSFKPENWKVEFSPERVDALKPGEFKQVEIYITPYEEALVGDYSVSARVEGEKAGQTIEFRISVKASSAWAWVGIGIIVLVVLGLTGLFRKLGRR